MVQFIIVFMGIITVSIFNLGKPSIMKYGSLISLTTQPFWIYETYTNSQYGMFALSIVYTILAGVGVYRGFILGEKRGK